MRGEAGGASASRGKGLLRRRQHVCPLPALIALQPVSGVSPSTLRSLTADPTRRAARRPCAGNRAASCMRSSPPQTTSTARTSPLSPHGRPQGQVQVPGVGAGARLGPLQRRRTGHVCILCSGGRVRTGPALAAVPVPEQRGLPGGRRPARRKQHGYLRHEQLHERRDLFLRSAHRAPPPLWRAAPGWRLRANLREVRVPLNITRRFSTVWPRLVAGLFIRKGSSLPLAGGVYHTNHYIAGCEYCESTVCPYNV